MEESAPRPEVFRPRRPLVIAMAAGGLIWVAVLLYLLTFEGVPLRTILSAIFFIAFFGTALVYYARTAIFLDAGGLTYRGMVGKRRLSFQEIGKLEVIPGLVTVYAVRAGARRVHFTSFFAGHRRLAKLLVERCGLNALPG